MKLYLDSTQAPENWEEFEWFRSADMAKFYVEMREVDGDPYDGIDIGPVFQDFNGFDGIGFLKWLEDTGRNYPVQIHGMSWFMNERMMEIVRRNGWDKLEKYTVGLAVEGRVYVDIKARGLDGAVESASAEVCDYDFGPLECIEWDEVNVEDSRGSLYRCEDEDFEDYPEQETEQSYTVCFAVKGRVYPRVAACSILEAVKKANDEVSDYDFGPLESIDWGTVYVEDPIGRRYDNKGNLSELAQACVDELIANAEAQKQEHNCLGECFEQDFVKE